MSILDALADQRKHAAQEVIRLREARDWTHEDLAHEAGVSVKTISRIENAKHEPRKTTREAIARVFGLTSEDLWPRPAPLGLDTKESGRGQLDRIEEMLIQLVAREARKELDRDLERAAQKARDKAAAAKQTRHERKRKDQAS